MITCSDAVKQLWDYLDGAIKDKDRAAIEDHLNVCRRCCGEVEFAEELRSFLAGHASDEIPDDARVRLSAYLDELQEN